MNPPRNVSSYRHITAQLKPLNPVKQPILDRGSHRSTRTTSGYAIKSFPLLATFCPFSRQNENIWFLYPPPPPLIIIITVNLFQPICKINFSSFWMTYRPKCLFEICPISKIWCSIVKFSRWIYKIFEWLNSERSYLKSLQIIVLVFQSEIIPICI